jgi:hypothetical protein
MNFTPRFMRFSVPPSGARGLFIWQNVDLFDTPTNNLGLQSRLNNPLYNNYHIVANFAMVVVSILFLLYAFQIYNKMQMGDTKLLPMMTRFFLGLVVFLASLSFLNSFAQKQDYNNNSFQNLNRPKLSK